MTKEAYAVSREEIAKKAGDLIEKLNDLDPSKIHCMMLCVVSIDPDATVTPIEGGISRPAAVHIGCLGDPEDYLHMLKLLYQAAKEGTDSLLEISDIDTSGEVKH